MSLDISLLKNHGKVTRTIKALIYEDSHGEERMYLSDFLARFPQFQKEQFEFEEDEVEEVYEANITHNLTDMAQDAGLYEAIWRPYLLHPDCKDFGKDYDAEYAFECSVKMLAKDVIDPIEKGFAKLKSDPQHFRRFDAPNGWGTYDSFVSFVSQYLRACKENPDCEIHCSR